MEGDNVIQNDEEISNIFNNFFSNAVMNLNISYDNLSSNDSAHLKQTDPILKAICKYKDHFKK